VKQLHELIRRLPPGVEFLVVVSWAFGLPIFSSILMMGAEGGAGSRAGGALVFDNDALMNIVSFELLQSAFLVWFLWVRGWTLEKIGLSVSWRGTWHGWLLLLGTYVVLMGLQWLTSLFVPGDLQAAVQRYPSADPMVSMQLVFLASTVNGMFEEVFVAGYVITALSQVRGVWTAVNVSTVIRLLYHLYQGPLALITIIPLGLIFGHYYARTRQLWPLILAHILVDIIGLSALGRWLENG
jgi:membrane protease YdiL (CAAX protease family)